MDAIMLLTADHNRFRGLFTKFRAGAETDVARKILKELDVHTQIEEKIFYPGIREADRELGEQIAEGIEEHHAVDVLAGEVEAMPPGGEEWTAKMTVIIELVEHHAEEEEQEMFPGVKKALDADARAAMGQRMEALKARLGAPTAPDKAALTTEQLKKLAQEQEIPGRSSMDRDELAATVAPG